MTTPAALKQVLDTLDITKDENWTDDGAPMLDVVQKLANDDSITRDQINEAAPGFVRQVGETKTVVSESLVATGGKPKVTKPTAEKPPGEDLTQREFTDDEMRQILDRSVRNAEAKLVAAQQAQAEATKEVARCQNILQRAHVNHHNRFPQITPAANIKAHLQSQINLSRERAGLGPEQKGGEIVVNQIDATMQRNSKRIGQQRPNRPVMGGKLVSAA